MKYNAKILHYTQLPVLLPVTYYKTRLFFLRQNFVFTAMKSKSSMSADEFIHSCIALFRFIWPIEFLRGVLISFSCENPRSQSAVVTIMQRSALTM